MFPYLPLSCILLVTGGGSSTTQGKGRCRSAKYALFSHLIKEKPSIQLVSGDKIQISWDNLVNDDILDCVERVELKDGRSDILDAKTEDELKQKQPFEVQFDICSGSSTSYQITIHVKIDNVRISDKEVHSAEVKLSSVFISNQTDLSFHDCDILDSDTRNIVHAKTTFDELVYLCLIGLFICFSWIVIFSIAYIIQTRIFIIKGDCNDFVENTSNDQD